MDRGRGRRRERDKKSHKKTSKRGRSRSRSRSRGRRRSSKRRSRSKSRSKSRSAERKPRRRKKGENKWGMAPDPSMLSGMTGASKLIAGFHPNGIDKHQMLQAKRVYVGNVQLTITEADLREFFDTEVSKVPGRLGIPGMLPVCTVTIVPAKMFGFVEFNSYSDADIAVCMDGILFHGKPLKVRRPKDYVKPEGMPEPIKYCIPGIISTHVDDDSSKLFLGNLAPSLTDEQVKTFVSSFGPLKAFSLVRDTTTGVSKGYAFLAYLDPSVSDTACNGLNGMELCGKEVCCQKANVTIASKSDMRATGTALINVSNLNASKSNQTLQLAMFVKSRILILFNMVTAAELEQERDEIIRDVKEEMMQFGVVEDVVGYDERIFVCYATEGMAEKAETQIAGRMFNHRMIVTGYLSEANWAAKQFESIL